MKYSYINGAKLRYKPSSIAMAVAAGLFALASSVFMILGVQAADATYYQGFETDTSGWLDTDDSWYGNVERVASGTNGVISSEGDFHAVFEGDASTAPFTRFDNYRDTWTGDWTAEQDVYLDTSWSDGEGFDYSVAASGSDGNHQRDFIFHVGVVDGELLVNGSNNADFFTNSYKLQNDNDGDYYTVSESGWYTLQHYFYSDGGSLSVDLNLVEDDNTVVWTATRSNLADTIPEEVGGNRYGWFTHIDVAGGINVDSTELFVTVPDTTAPLATITNPLDDSEVAGDVILIGEVEDENPMNSYFRVEDSEGTVVGTSLYQDGRTTHEFDWDTTTVDDGEYTIYFEARDSEGNKAGTRANPGDSVDVIMVTVDNEVDNKQDCKNGNWVLGVSGQDFRNQGDCVSYFASDTQQEFNPDGAPENNARGRSNR